MELPLIMIDPFSPLAEITAALFVAAVVGCFIWRVVTLVVPKFPRGALASQLLLLGLIFAFALELWLMSRTEYSVPAMLGQFRGWVVLCSYSAMISVGVAPLTLIVGGIACRLIRWFRRKR